jgi:hypothetical protein
MRHIHMAEARKKLPQIVLPAGPLRFPALTTPDFGSQQYPKPEGRYLAPLVYHKDSASFRQVEAMMAPYYEEAERECERKFAELPVATRKKIGKLNMEPWFTELFDKDTEEPTGEVVVRASMTASGVYKKGPKEGERWTRRPMIYDARGNRMGWNPLTRREEQLPDIWGGTIAKVSVGVGNYFVVGSGNGGLKLYLLGVQVIDLKSSGERTAASLGFGVEEGGYEYAGEPAEETVGSSQGDTGADDNGDF